MPNSNTTPQLPIWPRGLVRLDGRILEVTTGDGVRVAVDDVVELGVEPPRAGRLSLTLNHRAGLDSARTSYGVQPEHEAALQRLVNEVAAMTGDA